MSIAWFAKKLLPLLWSYCVLSRSLCRAGADGGFRCKKDAHHGAMRGFVNVTRKIDRAAVFVDNASAHPQAQASTAFALGREKRLKEMRSNIISNAWSVVRNDNQSSGLSPLSIRADSRVMGRDADSHIPTRAGRLRSIRNEIGKDLS